MEESLEFYNNFDKKLINDYVFGNKRIVSAIRNLGQFVSEEAKSILDIGCGLGWSSYEFSKAFPIAHVCAVDLSPVLIDTASKLFGGQKNLSFKVCDLTQGLDVENRYDAIIMIDVYEHIPIKERNAFHKGIKRVLKEQGRLILACPSKYHQSYLRNNNPSGLQPVDEDVDFESIKTIANDIEGEVIFFEYQSIWMNYDYFYAVIEINPLYGSNTRKIKGDALILEKENERAQRVKTKLNVQVESNKKSKNYFVLKTFLKRIKNKLN